MKKSIIVLGIVLILIACNKNVGSSTAALDEKIDTAAMVVRNTMAGNFISYGQNVSGSAKVYLVAGKYSLALENFSTNNGPDLHVYLSTETQPADFIDLGKLKSTAGNQVYDITGSPDFAKYKYALIHCQQYNHLFGSAPISK